MGHIPCVLHGNRVFYRVESDGKVLLFHRHSGNPCDSRAVIKSGDSILTQELSKQDPRADNRFEVKA